MMGKVCVGVAKEGFGPISTRIRTKWRDIKQLILEEMHKYFFWKFNTDFFVNDLTCSDQNQAKTPSKSTEVVNTR